MNPQNDEVVLVINELIEWLQKNFNKHRNGDTTEREMARKEERWIQVLQDVVAELPEDGEEHNVSFLP